MTTKTDAEVKSDIIQVLTQLKNLQSTKTVINKKKAIEITLMIEKVLNSGTNKFKNSKWTKNKHTEIVKIGRELLAKYL
jgi:hypothetical protein